MIHSVSPKPKRQRLVAIIIIVASIVAGIALGLLAFETSPEDVREIVPLSTTEEGRTEAILPTAAPSEIIQAAPPVELIIPDLQVTTLVEHVGLDKENKMDVPKKANQVAWYKYGSPPGAPGNAVIAGHLDSEHGPAVFYNLTQLANGDTFITKDESGRTSTFQVLEVATYSLEDFPMDKVFGAHNEARLNLITCGGKFNNQTRNYSHRTVVYSKLIE